MANTIRDAGRETFWRQTLANIRQERAPRAGVLPPRETPRIGFLFLATNHPRSAAPRDAAASRPPLFRWFSMKSTRRRASRSNFAAAESLRLERIVSGRSPRRSGTRPGGEGGPAVIGATRGMRGGQVWIATAPVDMRKSFDGLAEVVRSFLGHDPLGGNVFVFRNRSSERVKILWWDGDGLTIYYKRLERGTFRFPSSKERTVAVDGPQLLRLLDGLEIAARCAG